VLWKSGFEQSKRVGHHIERTAEKMVVWIYRE